MIGRRREGVGKRERGGIRVRERERERETGRQTDRQTDGQKYTDKSFPYSSVNII